LGIVAAAALASLRHRRRCGAGFVVALAPLPSLLGHCCRHGAGTIAAAAMDIVTVLVLAPSLLS
jgi:hypothetical protein